MIVLDFVKQNMPGGWKQTPSGWISGNCPMCSTRGHSADKRKRGGFMFNDDKVQRGHGAVGIVCMIKWFGNFWKKLKNRIAYRSRMRQIKKQRKEPYLYK